MDASHLITLVIGAVLGILFLKLLPYCSILFMEVCQKLKTLILFRSPTPSESLNTIESVEGDYDVFLSFHGEDTCNNFVCHLYEELNRKGIRTFKDDKRLEKGKSITPSLIEAIKKSKISIVVFSPNYASSSRCLNELLKIVECMETKKQLVLPVFVNVDPSYVEKPKFAKALRKPPICLVSSNRSQKWKDALYKISTIVDWDSRNCFDRNQAELIQRIAGEVSRRCDRRQKWRDALFKISKIVGWDSWNRIDGNQAELIQSTAEKVSNSLICKESSLENPLVGIDSYMMDIDAKLDLKCNDVRMLGIWGPGGIGKTTIARYIYDHYSSRYGYEACCFLRDVKDKYDQEGAISLQKELISDTLSERDLIIRDEIEGCNVIRRLQSKKVLIVLDDVDKKEQLEVLADKVEWFGAGSRIIITTRDKDLLDKHDVENVYEVQFLEKDKALQLFSFHAFKKSEPPTEFLELSNRFVSFGQCLPLTLKVLGKVLYKREMDFWQTQLEKLKRYPHVETYQTLKISYDELDEFYKEVFLLAAFFFDGKAKAEVEDILHKCGFYPQFVLPILEERSFLTFSFNKYRNSKLIHMHDLIKIMGHEIVREESRKDPSKRSRLCNPSEIKNGLTKETGETFIEGVCESMNLRILKILHNHKNGLIVQPEIHFPEGLGSLLKELSYFFWDHFPLKLLPFTSFGENLVELLLPRSKMEYLWEGEMEFKNLKNIDLTRSSCLKVFPDLSGAPNIEQIIFEGCCNCYEFPSDLSHLHKLKFLNFICCDKLEELPILPPSIVKVTLSSPVKELHSRIRGFCVTQNCKHVLLGKSNKNYTDFSMLWLGDEKKVSDFLITNTH